jgi:hypothetical protein
MLSPYAWRVVALFDQISTLKEGLGRTVGGWPNARAPRIETDPDNGLNAESLLINTARTLADELGMESTRLQINTLVTMGMINAPYSEFDNGLTQLAVRIQEDLRSKAFLFVQHSGIWGQDKLFGEKVAKKLKDCARDIRSAGNCLATGEATARRSQLGGR